MAACAADAGKDLLTLEHGLLHTSHTISKDEAKFVYEKGAGVLILGTGQDDNVRLSPEAAEYFEKKDCKVVAMATPQAIDAFNRSKKDRIGLFHVTC